MLYLYKCRYAVRCSPCCLQNYVLFFARRKVTSMLIPHNRNPKDLKPSLTKAKQRMGRTSSLRRSWTHAQRGTSSLVWCSHTSCSMSSLDMYTYTNYKLADLEFRKPNLPASHQARRALPASAPTRQGAYTRITHPLFDSLPVLCNKTKPLLILHILSYRLSRVYDRLLLKE